MLFDAEANADKGAAMFADQCAGCHGEKGEGTDEYTAALIGDWPLQQLVNYIDAEMPDDDADSCVADDARAVATYMYDQFYSPDAQLRNAPPRRSLARLTVEQYRASIADAFSFHRDPQRWPNPRDTNTKHGLRGRYYDASHSKQSRLRGERVDATVNFNFGFSSPQPFQALPLQPQEDESKTKNEDKSTADDKSKDEDDSAESEDKKKEPPKPKKLTKKEREELDKRRQKQRDKNKTIDSREFHIRWDGSVLAPVTGRYKIIIDSHNAFAVHLNSESEMLIDNLVKSGDQTRYVAEIYLVAGRAYPIRIEFTKRKRNNADQLPASFSLKWDVPGQGESTIPSHCMIPRQMPVAYVCETTFPADDSSIGYVRGNRVSKQWLEATSRAAIEMAGKAVEGGGFVNPRTIKPEKEREALQWFGTQLCQACFRRPPTAAEIERYVTAQIDAADSPTNAMKRMVILILKSPNFLYPEISLTKPSASEMGQDDRRRQITGRLALCLWNGVPTKWMRQQTKKLPAKIETIADEKRWQNITMRIVDDPRATHKIVDALMHWLHTEGLHDLSKDSQVHADFDVNLQSDLKRSMREMLRAIVVSESSDYRQLFTADWIPTTARMREFYSAQLQSTSD
ncbi:MAG: PA14 domain-containing protein, partial [Planctomycetota bacterium]